MFSSIQNTDNSHSSGLVSVTGISAAQTNDAEVRRLQKLNARTEHLLLSREGALALVESNGLELKSLSGHYQADEEIVMAAVQNNPSALKYAKPCMCRNRDIIIAAACSASYRKMSVPAGEIVDERYGKRSDFFKYANIYLRRDRAFLLVILRIHGMSLRYAPLEFRADREIVFTAVCENSEAIVHACAAFRADREMVIEAVSKNGWVIRKVDRRFLSDYGVALAAVTNCGMIYEYLSPDLRAERSIILAAARTNPMVILRVPEKLQYDLILLLAAIHENPQCYVYIFEGLQYQRDLALAAVSGSGSILQHVPVCMWHDTEILLAAIRSDPRAVRHLLKDMNVNEDVACALAAEPTYGMYHTGEFELCRFISDERVHQISPVDDCNISDSD